MKNVEANKVSGVMSRLLKNEEGNIIALLAASVIPVFGLMGGGFDMSRIYLSQTRLQGACDAGALIGRKTMGLGKWADNDSAANKQAEKLFDQNFPDGVYGTNNRVRSFAESNGNVTGTASVTIPMTLMRVLGQESQTVKVNCQAELRVPNTDVMFVLDTTGSMDDPISGVGSERKIVGLRKAVKCFYEALAKQNITDVAPSDCGEKSDPVASNLGNVQLRFGFVPYAVNVNVGGLLPLDYMADKWTYQSREASTGTSTGSVPIYGQESSPVNSGTPKNTSVADTNWANTEEDIVVGKTTYEWTSTMKKKDCDNLDAPKSQRVNEVGATEFVSQSPAKPVAPNAILTRTYQQVTVTADRTYQYVFVKDDDDKKGNCVLQFRDTSRNKRTTTTTTTTPITWPQNTGFTGWTYKPVTFNVSGLKDTGTNSWRSSLQLPIGTDGANITVNWNGCIEERQTFRAPDSNPSNDWDPIPKDALDMDIDLVPTKSNTATQWGPMLPSAIWQRYTVNNSGNRTDTRTTSNIWVAENSSVTMETVTNNCPTVAKKFQTWTASAFRDYVNSLATGGNTYHDIGLLWGARIMSPTGIFAELNAPKDKTIERHMVFMTDGDTYTEDFNYSAYGVHWYDRRQTPVGTEPTRDLLNDLTNARTVALCKAIKDKNINLWVVSYGSVSGSTSDRLRACATPGKFVQASSVASLISNFKEIAAKISALRLTK